MTNSENYPLSKPTINFNDQEITVRNVEESINSGKVFRYPHNMDFQPIPVLSYMTNTQISAVSGALAGFLAGVSVCPLDVAKTRLQAQGVSGALEKSRPQKYKGIFNTLSKIYTDEGIRGLYRGLVPITVGYLPTWMIYFTVYEKCKTFYPKFFAKFGINFSMDGDERSFGNFFGYSLSAMSAGAVSTTVTNPIWVVKTRLMVQTGNGKSNHYNGTLHAFRKMYRNEGFKVFYSGLVPSYFGLLHVAIHFPVYEYLKKILHCTLNDKTNKKQILSENDLSAKQERFYFFLKLIFASSLSKMIASSLTYPHEVVRTRLQISSLTHTEKPTLIQILREIVQNEGVKGLYSGYTTNLTRTVPSSAVTLVSFEFIRNYLESVNCLDEKLAH